MENIMVELGKYNKLKIVKALEVGAYLDGGDYGELLRRLIGKVERLMLRIRARRRSFMNYLQ